MSSVSHNSSLIGRTLGHFEILEKLGEGGMGIVYKARDTHLDRFVAIKILPPDRVGDAARRLRFAQEAKSASALNHPGIITIHDIAQHDGIDFIAMEFLPGRTLDRVIPRHGLRLNETLDYGIQIADALAAAHAAGIVHRDLKPANVIVTDQGRIKLLDFGLAKLVERPGLASWNDGPTATQRTPMTGQGAIVGTVAYMAPEQAEGKAVDARTDIFSFGSVLYEMVTGRRAFNGDTPLSTLTAVLREEPKPVSDAVDGLPHELERLITRCLQKNPERRWQAMADVRVALRELKEESDSGALPSSTPAAPRRRRLLLPTVAVVLAVIGVGVIGAVLWRNREVRSEPSPPALFAPIPLTSYPGREQQPSFSPDGSSVAFSWNGESQDNWDIYVKLIGPGSPQRLTTDTAIDLSPAWSPDGRSIAFVRARGGGSVVIIVPSRGGPEREVLEVRQLGGLGVGRSLAWSADSGSLFVATMASAEGSSVLTALDVATGERRRITTPPAGTQGDSLPSVSPDGRMLAFVRRSGIQTGEVNVLRLSAALAPIGEPFPIGRKGLFYHGLAWSADGRDVIVASGNTGDIGLWRIALDHPDRPERLSPPGEECRQPTVAVQGRLAFTRANWDENIWRLTLSSPGRPAGTPAALSGSTRLELNAQFSPDGSRIAFESLRSGTQEIWVADADGRNALELTSFGGQRGGTPAWSRDGQSIAFDWRKDDARGDIYVVPVRGGAPRRLTDHPADDLTPSWSRDGRSLYFASTRTGVYQVWKLAPQGGEPVQLTKNGGVYGKESLDGKYLYYAKFGTALPTMWRVPVSGGEEVRIDVNLASYSNFAVAREGIYFEAAPASSPLGHIPMLSPFTRPESTIDFLSFATGKVSRVVTVERHAGHGMDVSPDGRTLMFGQMDTLTEDLMLVENFK